MSQPTRSSLVDVQFFFFNSTATTEIYTLSLHDALPISRRRADSVPVERTEARKRHDCVLHQRQRSGPADTDRKSTRLNSSHGYISYAVFCLKKKKSTISAHPITIYV